LARAPTGQAAQKPFLAVTAGDCSGISTCLLCVDDAAIDQAIGLYYDALVATDAKSKDKHEKALNKCQATMPASAANVAHTA